jgi:hypothetical protein
MAGFCLLLFWFDWLVVWFFVLVGFGVQFQMGEEIKFWKLVEVECGVQLAGFEGLEDFVFC